MKNTFWSRALALFLVLLFVPFAAFANPLGEEAVVIDGVIDSSSPEDRVLPLQRQLAVLGFFAGEYTGVYDEATKEAVRAFGAYTGIGVQKGASEKLQEALYAMRVRGDEVPLAMGSKGVQIERLQKRLKVLGYYAGDTDGKFGSNTRLAVRAFQTAAGFDEDCIASCELQALLFSRNAPAAKYRALTVGDSGEEVERLQEMLIRLGFSAQTAADGAYGGRTKQAVANAQTYYKGRGLMLGSGKVRSGVLANGAPSGGTTGSAGAGERIMGNGEDPYAISVTGTMDPLLLEYLYDTDTVTEIGTPKLGDSGEGVRRLQRRLNALGYLYGGMDGKFGSSTEKALEEFQDSNSLLPTGRCDTVTRSLLFSDEAQGKLHKYLLKVNTAQQKVFAYTYDENGEYTELVRTMTCSTGKDETPTPKGTFTNTMPSSRWYYFEEFDTWAQYAFIINGGVLFHSVLYNDRDESTLIRSSVSKLGRKASHGCIRLSVENARWIWTHCDAHTTIIVE